MKVINIGSAGNYDDVTFSLSKIPNKFGSMYYFKDRIYLVQDKPTTNYTIWSNGNGDPFLTLADEHDLITELLSLCRSLSKKDETINFKELKQDERLYVKFSRDCGKIASNCELTYCICVYGFFKKPDGTSSFLQMEVAEHSTRKFSLLGKRKAASDDYEVVPVKQTGEECCSFSCNNYTPNASGFT